MVKPFPSWPLELEPQHWTPPFAIAQVWEPPAPAEIDETPLVRPATDTGA